MVIILKIRNINFSSIFILFLLSYSFYCFYLLGQINLNLNGKSIIWIYVILTLLIPFSFLLMSKVGEKARIITLNSYLEKNHKKSFFILKILFSVYLIISGIFISFYTIYFESTYFYSKYNIYIISIILFIPFLLFSNKIIKSTLHLHPLNLIVYIFFFFLFFRNHVDLKYYTLSFEPFNNTNLIITTVLLIPLLFEPFMFFYLFDFSKEKIVKRKMIGGIILLSITGAYSFLQVGNQFGALLNHLEFPFFQLWKNIYINEYVENLDCFNIIIFILNALSRLLLSACFISKLFYIDNRIIPIFYGFVSLSIGCLFTTNLNLFEDVKIPLLTINSLILLICFTITVFHILKLGGIKNVEQQNIKIDSQ